MTPFVTNLAGPYLKYMNNSVVEHGHPCGLVALILVSVSPVFLGFNSIVLNNTA